DAPRADDDPALKPFAAHFRDKKDAAAQQDFRRERGDGFSPVVLKDLAFYHVTQPFKADADRPFLKEHWKDLEPTLAERGRADRGLRYSVAPAYPWELNLSAPSAEKLREVQQAVEERERELGLGRPPAWESVVPCDTFAVRFMLLNPDLDTPDTQE